MMEAPIVVNRIPKAFSQKRNAFSPKNRKQAKRKDLDDVQIQGLEQIWNLKVNQERGVREETPSRKRHSRVNSQALTNTSKSTKHTAKMSSIDMNAVTHLLQMPSLNGVKRANKSERSNSKKKEKKNSDLNFSQIKQHKSENKEPRLQRKSTFYELQDQQSLESFNETFSTLNQ